MIAELRGWAPLTGIQVEYSLGERTSDRELLAMAQAFGLGTVGWSPLGGGLLTGKYRRGEAGRATSFGRLIHTESDARKTATVDVLLVVAEKAGVSPTVAALAWMGTRGVFPILGPRTVEQLQDDLAAADYDLSADHVERLDAAGAVPLGFPHNLIAEPGQLTRLSGGMPGRIEAPATPIT